MSSLLNEEMIALEWFWDKKKDDKPKPKRIVSKKDYPIKAINEYKKLLKTKEYSDIAKYFSISLNFGTYRDFTENNMHFCVIGQFRLPRFHSTDVNESILSKIYRLNNQVMSNINDETYRIDLDEQTITISEIDDFDE